MGFFDKIFGPILYRPMGMVLNFFYGLTGNIGIAILLLTITVNVILFPLSIRQQKTMAKQTALKPKLDRLKEKFADNKQRLTQETQELYQREGVSLTGGCLTSLLRLPFLFGIYSVIRNPLQYMLGVSGVAEALSKFSEIAGMQQGDLSLMTGKGLAFIQGAYPQIAEHVNDVNFDFLGLNLTVDPAFRPIAHPNVYWFIPLFAFAMALLSSVVMMMQNKKNNPEAAGSMGAMTFMLPFVSLWIAFKTNAALGLYWGFSSLVTTIIQVIVNKFYGPYSTLAGNYRKTVKKRREYEKKKKELRGKVEAQ